MPQLDPTWFASQLFWLFICFVALYVVLSRAVLPPLLGVMAKRKETVESDLSAAQRFKSEAETAREQYERTMGEARQRSQQLLIDAMLEQKARAEAAAKDQDAQIAAKLHEAQRAIARKKQELMDALTPATAELTAMIVEKLTQQEASGNDNRKTAAGGSSKGR